MITRAVMLTASVITKSTRPLAIRAEMPIVPASFHFSAMLAAKVMPLDSTGKDTSLQDKLNNFGDLKYLLSDQFSDISIKVKHIRILRDEQGKESALVVFMERAHCTLAQRLNPKENARFPIDFKKKLDDDANSSRRSSCMPPSKRRGSVYSARSYSTSICSDTRGGMQDVPSAKSLLIESEIRKYARVLTDHLAKLHSKFVEHADIKPENLLLKENGLLLLTDFGLSFGWDGSNKVQEERGGGTGCYAPPQEDEPPARVGTKDVWALGQTLRAMFVGYSNLDQQVFGIDAVLEEIERERFPGGISGDAKSFIAECLKLKANERATCVQLLTSDWFVRNGK